MLHGDLLGERARLTPAKAALVDVSTGMRHTYAELDARAVAAARVLRETLSLAKGDRFGILAGNRVEFLDLFFGAPKAGVVLVPLGTRLTAHELQHIVRDSGLRGLAYGAEFAPTVTELRSLARLEHAVAFDLPALPRDRHWEALVAQLPARSDWRREPCLPEEPYALLYTSGTTGKPKGVVVPHRMVAWNGYNTVACWQLREDDVSPIFTPLYHAGGLGAFLVPIFAIGGTIVLHRGFDAAEIWRTIEKERCTVVLGVPTIWKLLMEAPEFRTVDLSHVRWLISGGAPLPEYLIEAYQARGVVFKQGYGLTEVGVNCFAMTVEESIRKKGSIGKPLMFTETKLVDTDGNQVPVGEVGQLLLRGPHVSLGYWRNPEATAAALDASGFFHTGDLARQDAEGFHFIAGRGKDMLISGGVNVYPAEIEAQLLLHPELQDAAVIGAPDPTWGEIGVAFVVRRPGAMVGGPALVAHLEGRLARYKIPKDWVFVEALPRTPYGKVVKGELEKRYRGVLAHQVGGVGAPVLLLNGGLMSMSTWDPVAAALEGRHRVVRCDLRGQLLSPGEPPPSLDGHAGEVIALLDHLGLERVHVAGTSFGGLLGLKLAASHPERVMSLAVFNATDRVPAGSDEAAVADRLRQVCQAAAAGGDGGLVLDLLAPRTFSPAWLAAQGEALRRRRQQISSLPAAWFGSLAALLAALEGLDLRPDLGRIQCPVLVVAAELDRTFPVECSRALAAGLAHATLEMVPAVGHALVVEAPDRVAAVLQSFLARLGPEGVES